MVTSLSTGDKIHVGDSVTLTLLAIEGDLIRFGVESSEPGGHGLNVLIEGTAESGLNWWELN
jgi:hypothetical protein